MSTMKGGSGNALFGIDWRFRNDDGVETQDETGGGATWRAALNTNITMSTTAGGFRLRFGVGRYATGAISVRLQFAASLNGGAYSPITRSLSSVRCFASDWMSNNDEQTDYGPAGLNNGESMYESPGDLAYISDTDCQGVLTYAVSPQTALIDWQDTVKEGMDIEGCFYPWSAGLVAGDYVDIRPMAVPSTIFGAGYASTPRITFTAPEVGVTYPHQRRAYAHNLRR